MNSYGLKVSRDGYDIKTATVLEQVFNSSYNCLKIERKISFSNTGSGFREVDVTHDFGYRPAFLAFFQVSGNGRWYAQGQIEDITGGSGQIFEIRSYIDKLTFSLGSSNSKEITVVCFLFVDPGE